MRNTNKLGFGHDLLKRMTLVVVIGQVGLVSCQSCSEGTIESTGNIKMSVEPIKLYGCDTTFNIIVQRNQDSYPVLLKDYKLKLQVQYPEQENNQNAMLQYNHQHQGKQEFTNEMDVIINDVTSGATLEQDLCIPITLQPQKHTKLKVVVNLLKEKNNMLQSVTVEWVKYAFSIVGLEMLEVKDLANHTAKKEALLQLSIQNEQSFPINASEIMLSLTSRHENETLSFTQTQTTQAQLNQLCDLVTLNPGSSTINVGITWPTADATQLSSCIISISPKGTEFLDTTSKEIDLARVLSIDPANRSQQAIPLQEGEAASKDTPAARVVQEAEKPNSVQEGQREVKDTFSNGLQEAYKVVTGQKDPVAGTHKEKIDEQEVKNTEAQEKPQDKKEPIEKPALSGGKESIEQLNPLEKQAIVLANIKASIEVGSSSKRYKIIIVNQGNRISQALLNKVKLVYAIQDTDSQNVVKIKRRNTNNDLQGVGLGDIFHTGLQAQQEKSFEVALDIDQATHVTTQFLLQEEDQTTEIGSWTWAEQEKPTKPKTQKNDDNPVGSWQDIKATFEPCRTTPKKINITLKTQGEAIHQALLTSIKFQYTITGEGDLSGVKIKRGKLSDVNQASLASLYKPLMRPEYSQKAQFILDPGEATEVTIQFSLEKDGETSNIGQYTWKK